MSGIKCNYHTHTYYCDGIDGPEDIILTAIEKGFSVIGISGHSHTAFDESYAMSLDTSKAYRAEILELKEKYKDRITVLCGLEYDYYSDEEKGIWDYRVGSVHYIREPGGTYIPVDETAEITLNAVDEYFGGDIYSLCECYFETVSDVVNKTDCNLIGHFDLVTKFNEKVPMIDVKHPRYVAAYRKALDVLVPLGVPFEMNSNAVAKGYRTAPYPSMDILKEIRERGGKIILSSDAHDRNLIDFYFEEMAEIARNAGFSKVSVIDTEGEKEIDL